MGHHLWRPGFPIPLNCLIPTHSESGVTGQVYTDTIDADGDGIFPHSISSHSLGDPEHANIYSRIVVVVKIIPL
jgi:hypothetical protein